MAATRVPERRLASPVCHSVDFGPTKMRFQRYTVDVCVVFTSFYCENRFLTPSERAPFSVPLLTLWDENCFFRVPAIACSKSILIRPVHSKSTSRKNTNFENSFRSSLCGCGTLLVFLGVQNAPQSGRNMHRL